MEHTREQGGEGRKMYVGGGEGMTKRKWVVARGLRQVQGNSDSAFQMQLLTHATAAYLDSIVSLRWLQGQEAKVRNGGVTEGLVVFAEQVSM